MGVLVLLLGLSIGILAAYRPIISTSQLNSTFSTPVNVDPNDYKAEVLSMSKGEIVNYAMQLDNETMLRLYIMNATQYSVFLKCAPRCIQPLLGGKGSYYEQAGLTRQALFVNASVSESKPFRSNFTAPTSGTFYFVFDNSVGGNWSTYLGQNATGSVSGTIKMTVYQIATTYTFNLPLIVIGASEIVVGGLLVTILWTPRITKSRPGRGDRGFFLRKFGAILVIVAILSTLALDVPIYYSAATNAKTFVPVGNPQSSTNQTNVGTTAQASNYSIFEIDSDYLSNIGTAGYGQMSLDTVDQLLFIAAKQNNSIYIYDLPNEAESDVTGFNYPQSTLYVEQSNGTGELFVGNGGNGTVDILTVNDTSYPITLQKVAELDFTDPGYLTYDNSSGLVYVGYGTGNQSGLGIINPGTNSELGNIPLAGQPGQIAIEQNGTSIFVGIPGAIDVIDKTTQEVIATWPVSGATGTVAIALDETDNQLFVTTPQPPALKVLDDRSGAVLSTMSLPSAAGDVGYDPESGLVFASCSSGTLQVFQPNLQDPGSYLFVAGEPTGPAASTSVFYPSQEYVFVAIPQYPYQLAQLMTFGIYAD